MNDKTKRTNPKDLMAMRKVPTSTVSGVVEAEVGLAMLEGALKYGRHNYRVIGVKASVYYDAARRHITDWWEGEDYDADSIVNLHHISKAIASLVVLRDAMIQDKFNDDRPPKSPKGWMGELNAKALALIEAFKGRDVPEAYTEENKDGFKTSN